MIRCQNDVALNVTYNWHVNNTCNLTTATFVVCQPSSEWDIRRKLIENKNKCCNWANYEVNRGSDVEKSWYTSIWSPILDDLQLPEHLIILCKIQEDDISKCVISWILIRHRYALAMTSSPRYLLKGIMMARQCSFFLFLFSESNLLNANDLQANWENQVS